MIKLEELKSILDYDPETGIFSWSKPRPKIRVGQIAGCLHHKGYRHVELAGKHYACHRLAWFYQTGEWPREQIDHVNRNRDDNRFCNLREATNGQNRANCKPTSKHGLKGISFHSWLKERPWEARLNYRKDGKRVHQTLGCYSTKEEAHRVYMEKMRAIHPEHFAP